MKIRTIFLYAVPLLLVAGIAYGSFHDGKTPDYVLDAMSSVSNKMSYNYGITSCKANQQDVDQWAISCSSVNTPNALTFTVQPSEKAPYDISTRFYLIADNDAAKKSANEGLMGFLMINTDVKAEKANQLADNSFSG